MSDVEDQAKKEKRERKELKKEKREKKELKKESKKRSSDDIEEISIDLTEPAPLSKKQKRLLRQGKLTTKQLEKKNKIPKPLNEEEKEEATNEDGTPVVKEKKKEKSEFGVWIGNLSFDTTKEELTRFLIGKTLELPVYNDQLSSDELVRIEESDISRVNLPKNEKKIKGFAYVDFEKINHVYSAISLSEQHLNGRNLLIKNANSFEGRPKKDPVLSLSKNPPSRILFVGNLSFDTTRELLEEHFQSCGEIIKIRMATFEDTGKCKGFAFIDFKDEKGPTAALSNKLYKKLINRPLRLEFGEDRSKRTPHRKPRSDDVEGEVESSKNSTEFRKTTTTTARERTRIPHEERSATTAAAVLIPERESRPARAAPSQPYRGTVVNHDMAANQRLKSSVALASAQRASSAIVKSTGKKITF